MRLSNALASALPLLANAVRVAGDPLPPYRRSSPTVPVQTPTGTVCAGATATSTVSPAQLAAAVQNCTNVQPLGSNPTRNDIVSGICKPYTFIFARGTSEDGNLGNIVGPPFISALENVLGKENLTVQGVNNYAAVGSEYCAGGSLTAAQDLAQLITCTAVQCPNTHLTVSGYSQGSQVVHNAFALLASDKDTSSPAPSFQHVLTSVVLFGDPDRNLPLDGVPASDILIDCHEGDDICDNGENVLVPHVTYCQDVAAQAEFVRSRSVGEW